MTTKHRDRKAGTTKQGISSAYAKKLAAAAIAEAKARSTPPNRFAAFNPCERAILRLVLQNHLNTVSEIAISTEPESRVAHYLAPIEELENELNEASL